MNCRHCGSKLGMLERWRSGDFCSQEHKDEFAHDLVRLKEQNVKDLRQIPNRLKRQHEVSVESPRPLEPDLEPAPPIAGFVPAQDPVPLVLMAKAAEPEPPPAPRGKGDQWRLFAKVADWSELPVAVLAASQRKQLRFVWVVYSDEPIAAANGSLLRGEYPATLPHPELRRWQAQLAMAIHSEPSAIVTPAAPQTVEQQYWVDDQGWRWIPEGAAVTVPDFGPVLSEYPVAAPWLNWAVGAGFTPRPSSGQQIAPGARPAAMEPFSGQPRSPTPPMGLASGHSSAIPPGRSGPAGWPTNTVAPSNAVSLQSAWPGGPAPSSGMPGPSAWPANVNTPSGCMPAQPAWPGGPAWAGGLVGYAPHPSAIPPVPPWSTGLVWQELPPPLFNALVDPSHSVKPVAGVRVQHNPQVESIASPTPPAPHAPSGTAAPRAALSIVDCQGDPLANVVPAGIQPVRCDWQPRALWRRMLALPVLAIRLPQPGVPMRAAPPLRLQIRSLPPIPAAVPVLYSGRWID